MFIGSPLDIYWISTGSLLDWCLLDLYWIPYWISIGSLLDLYWISTWSMISNGSLMDLYWISTASLLDLHWISTGLYWIFIGSPLDPYWISTGSLLDWISTGSLLDPLLDLYWVSTWSQLDLYWLSTGHRNHITIFLYSNLINFTGTGKAVYGLWMLCFIVRILETISISLTKGSERAHMILYIYIYIQYIT